MTDRRADFLAELDGMSLMMLYRKRARMVARYNEWANTIDSGAAIALAGSAFDWAEVLGEIEKRIAAKKAIEQPRKCEPEEEQARFVRNSQKADEAMLKALAANHPEHAGTSETFGTERPRVVRRSHPISPSGNWDF